MKQNRLLIGAGVLVALIVVAVLMSRNRAADDGEASSSTNVASALPNLDKSQIDFLEIRRPNEAPIQLRKTGDTWRVAAPVDAATDSTTINAALDRLDEMEAIRVAATRRENYARLEVDAEHAIRVIVKRGATQLADFWIGTSSGNNTMVRVEGQTNVLAVEGSLRFAFNKELKDWRDRVVTDFSADSVTRVAFQNENGHFEFAKNEGNWVAQAGTPTIERFSTNKVQQIVQSLARLRATDFGDAGTTLEAAGVAAPNAASITLTLNDEDAGVSQIVLRRGAAHGDGASEYYLVKEGDPVVYVISSYVANRMAPNVEALQDPVDAGAPAAPPAAPEMGGMPGMPGGGGPGGPGGGSIPPEVMEQLRRQMQQQGAQH